MNKGVVLSVNRRGQACGVQLLGSQATVTASYLTTPPPPRSVVMVQDVGNGSWVVLGTIGERRVTLHDDFHYVLSAAVTGPQYCDTNWSLAVNGACLGSGPGNLVDNNVPTAGQLSLSTNGSAATGYVGLTKGDGDWFSSAGNVAHWMSVRFAAGTFVTSVFEFGMGTFAYVFGGGAGAFGAGVRIDDTQFGGHLQSLVCSAGVYTQIDLGVSLLGPQAWNDIDILYIPGTRVMFWLNGGYVGQVTTNVPATGTMPPVLLCYMPGAAFTYCYVDFIHCETFQTFVQP